MPTIDEQEHLVNSDDEDDQAQMPVDDVQTECNHQQQIKIVFFFFYTSFVF